MNQNERDAKFVNNGNFIIPARNPSELCAGWYPIGGSKDTSWRWKHKREEVGLTPGLSEVEIRHPMGSRAGIIQTQGVEMPAQSELYWEVETFLNSDTESTQGYLRAFWGELSGPARSYQEFEITSGRALRPYRFQLVRPQNCGSLRLETGVKAPGTLHIHSIRAYRSDSQEDIPQVNRASKVKIPKFIENAQINEALTMRQFLEVKKPEKFNLPKASDFSKTAKGKIKIEIDGHSFQESREDVTADRSGAFTVIRDVSGLVRFSYAVLNFGSISASIQCEISPDAVHWAKIDTEREIRSQELIFFPLVFTLRYIRLAYRADSPCLLRIWIQAQN